MARKRVIKFDVEAFLSSAGVGAITMAYSPRAIVFAQGDPSTHVLYIQNGSVKLSVVSAGGKEAVVAVLHAQHFFGEGALAGQPVRLATATAMTDCRILAIPKRGMLRLLHLEPAFSDLFIAYMLGRTSRLEEDLVDQMFNAAERRLARTLMFLARFGTPRGAYRVMPKISQEVLAEMIGTTRSRVNMFMNKFRKLGFIEYNGTLKVHDSLLTVVLHGSPKSRT